VIPDPQQLKGTIETDLRDQTTFFLRKLQLSLSVFGSQSEVGERDLDKN